MARRARRLVNYWAIEARARRIQHVAVAACAIRRIIRNAGVGTIAIGAEGSGTQALALRLLDAVGALGIDGKGPPAATRPLGGSQAAAAVLAGLARRFAKMDGGQGIGAGFLPVD